MLRSMTGFGRCLVENTNSIQQWEIKSVNGRYLDLQWRLPMIAHYLEPNLEKVVRRHALRGRVEICLALQFTPGNAPRPVFDSAAASAMLDELTALAAMRGDEPRLDYSSFLVLPALWSDAAFEQDDELAAQLEGGLAIALEDWNESRAAEGEALGRDLLARILKMEEWTELISERAPEIKEERISALQERINEALKRAGTELEESRFLQEIALLADKLDISEELTRLFAHLERLQQLLRQGGDAGKRLDFTLQECFREINTCGAKVADPQLSRVIVDFKNELEKCREQAQNIE